MLPNVCKTRLVKILILPGCPTTFWLFGLFLLPVWLVGWLVVGFYGISTFVDYFMLNQLLHKLSILFQKFSLAWVHNLIVKNISISTIQFSQAALIQTIQFSISIVFVHTQIKDKIVLFQTIQFSLSRVSMSKTVLFQTIQFCMSTRFSPIWPTDKTLSGSTTPG